MSYIPRVNTNPSMITPSGRVLLPKSFGAVSIATLSSGIIYFAKLVVEEDQVFTGLQFAPVVVTGANYKMGLYPTLSDFPTGLPLTGTTGIISSVTTAAATAKNLVWGTPLTIPKGKYQAAILSDTTGTANAVASAGQANEYGGADATTANGTRLTFSQAYATGLTDLTGQTIVDNTTNVGFYFGLVAQ